MLYVERDGTEFFHTLKKILLLLLSLSLLLMLFLLLVVVRNMQYIQRDGKEFFHTLEMFPEGLTKKVTLLKYFRNYMSEHLLKVCLLCAPFLGRGGIWIKFCIFVLHRLEA